MMLTCAALAWLSGCASTLAARVTSFNQWPADVAGSTFSFISRAGAPGELEHAAYQTYVQTELEKRGFRRAAAGQNGRLQVDVTTGNRSEQKTAVSPVYQDTPVFLPPYRDAAGRLYPGVWAHDPFGPRYVGDRVVNYTVQVSSLQLRILDSHGVPAGQSRTVFESKAVYQGESRYENLPAVVPYLVRAVFDDFPGQNGQVRVVKFDAKTGELIPKER